MRIVITLAGNKHKWDKDDKSFTWENTNKWFQSNDNKSANTAKQTHLIVFNAVNDPMQFFSTNKGQYFNFDSHVNSTDVIMNNEHVIYYDWLADSVTMSHIYNAYNAFITYKPIKPIPVMGVGNIGAHIKGHGSVLIESHCDNADNHEYCYILGCIEQ